MVRWVCRASVFSVVALALVDTASAQKPQAVGNATVRVTYDTDSGERTWKGSFNFAGRGPMDALPLEGTDGKVGYMNSINIFGRRPLVPQGLRDDESVIANAFFKETANNRRLQHYFEDIQSEETMITVEVSEMTFDTNVELQTDTLMLHILWDIDQMDQLPHPYHHAHNQHTAEDPFRDYAHFFPNIFSDNPRNYTLAGLTEMGSVEVEGNGTNVLTLRVSFPYHIYKNLEEEHGQVVPEPLPAPFGFLEPWHFHLEYAVKNVSLERCTYTLRKSRGRRGCDTCPEVGETYVSDTVCESAGDCDRRVKTQIDCPDGDGFCKLRAKGAACAAP